MSTPTCEGFLFTHHDWDVWSELKFLRASAVSGENLGWYVQERNCKKCNKQERRYV